MPAWWDNAPHGTPWNPTPGPDQRYDYSVPLDVGTPVVSPVNGVVVGDNTPGVYAAYGRRPWGGEVDILTNLPDYGGPVIVDLIHFDSLNVTPGTKVNKGDLLGTSGGQLSGGNWPVSCCSTGAHLGIGVRSYKGFTPAWDPSTLVNNLLAGVDSSSQPTIDQQYQISGRPLAYLTAQAPPGGGVGGPIQPGPAGGVVGAVGGLAGNAVAAVIKQAFPGLGDPVALLNLVVRIGKFVMGFALVSLAAFVFFLPTTLEAAGVATGKPGLAEIGRYMQRRRKGATPQPASVTINTGPRASRQPPNPTPETTKSERTMYGAGVAAGRRMRPSEMARQSAATRRQQAGMTQRQQREAVEAGGPTLVQAPQPLGRMSPEEERAEQERQQRELYETARQTNPTPDTTALHERLLGGTVEQQIANLERLLTEQAITPEVEQRWRALLKELRERQGSQP